MPSSDRYHALLANLRERLEVVRDDLIPEDERIGTDVIRNKEDLAIVMRFMDEVYQDGKTESVWAAEHPRDYERVQRIASVAFGMILAIAEGCDERHSVAPTLKLLKPAEKPTAPSDVEWAKRMKVLVRLGFWGGLILAWCSALLAVT